MLHIDPNNQIRFGTDGWRAIIAKDFTLENLRRVSAGTALFMQKSGFHKVVIGHDCRFGGRMFLEEAARVFSHYSIEVLIADGFVSTPMVSLGAVTHKADVGIVITASHNPASYNGFKLKSSFGGPCLPDAISEVESLIPDVFAEKLNDFSVLLKNNSIKIVDLQAEYISQVEKAFDLNAIRKNVHLVYDAMYGSGQLAMKEIIPGLHAFHCEWNPGFQNTAPEPILKNLTEILAFIKSQPGKYIGVANDGDADRLAMIDELGNIVDSQNLLLLLVYYLAGVKSKKGKIVVSNTVTNKIKKIAALYGLEVIATKVGFKYIADYMIRDSVLIGGEESGGIAVQGHIPERDGIWIALTILEFMASTGKTLHNLVKEVHEIVGSFYYDRLDLPLTVETMQTVKTRLANDTFSTFGRFKVIQYDQLDGDKFFFEDDDWLMFRASGTEPVLRIYAQANNQEKVDELFKAARAVFNI
ncbi:MAG: phosphoglucomutase/phosphomannomutase family protein [Bacteroidota bacterium]|nr:phosphoglucomutase/phosphomannomutase family protein [Bacteroidota bacterium]